MLQRRPCHYLTILLASRLERGRPSWGAHGLCSSPEQQTIAAQNHRAMRLVSREDRVATLKMMRERSSAEDAELAGLMKKSFEEQYNPSAFTDSHVAFKHSHNVAFSALARYCHQDPTKPFPIFYLDGPAGETTKVLKAHGFHQLYVANRHQQSCDALVQNGSLKQDNVVWGDAVSALKGPLRNIPFRAYYFDGCGGYTPQIVAMMEAALSPRREQEPIVVGWSVVGGNRDIVLKEVQVTQALVQLAQDLNMAVRHVFDDPGRYGVDVTIEKVEGNTFTTWCVLEP